MDIRTSVQGKILKMRLKGRFEFTVHRVFREAVKSALADDAVKEIEIDLSGVDYMDSSALGMLLLSRENALATGKSISLAGAADTVLKVLNIANFERLFQYK